MQTCSAKKKKNTSESLLQALPPNQNPAHRTPHTTTTVFTLTETTQLIFDDIVKDWSVK